MLWNNLMEDKQLNFNQPLLSVRRNSSTAVAEKEEEKKNFKSFLPSIPRLPHYKSELKSGPVRNPGAVPFVWEQSPGKPKDESRPQTTYSERSSAAPKLPPGRIPKADEQEPDNAFTYATSDKVHMGYSHGARASPVVEKKGEDLRYAEDPIEEEENSDSTDDEVYVDALDTLSRSESFFLNCSVSGVSGFEDVELGGTVSSDPQAKNFMIGRFLPAAKAMVSESPQLAPKKQPILPNQPRQPKKVVNGNKQPQLRYGPSFAHQHSEYYDGGEEESDDDFYEDELVQAKVCGLVPRFFLKGSHCLLNHVPGRSVRTRPPIPPANRGGTVSSSASYWSKSGNEHSSFDTRGRKSMDGSQAIELHEENNDLTTKTKQISSKIGGTYPHNASDMPHYPNESKNTSMVDFNSPEKGYKSFKELLEDKSSSEEVDSGSLEVEKTLYIDRVHKLDPLQMESCPSFESWGAGQDCDNMRKGMWDDCSKESSLVQESIAVDDSDKPEIDLQKLPHFISLPSAEHIERGVPKAFAQDQDRHQDPKWQLIDKEVAQSLEKQSPKVENLERGGGICTDFSIPPPLPKSPSDSWLWRTLPSISSKNASLHPHLGTGPSPRYQASKTQPSNDSKWETMVKTSKARVQHLRYSEELLAAIPED